jgi:hypothetical protein
MRIFARGFVTGSHKFFKFDGSCDAFLRCSWGTKYLRIFKRWFEEVEKVIIQSLKIFIGSS